MKVVFRADADARIGGGHVMRCLSLAGQLRALGWRSRFVGSGATAAFIAGRDPGQNASALDERVDEVEALRASEPGGCDLLVVDHYGWSRMQESGCRGWARRILVIDDLATSHHDCDLLLDQTLARQPGDYRGLVPSGCEMLLGSRFALLREQFLRARPVSAKRREAGDPAPARILVGLGAMDGANATAFVLEALADAVPAVAVDVVLGSGAPHRAAVEALVGQGGFAAARLHVGVEDMASLMGRADLAIGAGGSGAWERCCMGLPTVIVNVADNQRGVAAALDRAGAARDLGLMSDLDPGVVRRAVAELLADPGRLHAMSEAALGLCDARGCLRVATALAGSRPVAGGGRLRLRVAEAGDAALMLRWQRDPSTRRFARNPRAPDCQEHRRWMRGKLGDPGCLFFMLELDARPCGVLRLDADAARGGFEVSILVAPDRQRLGIASLGLSLARTLVVRGDLHAFVMVENVASRRLFENMGYRPRGEGWYLNDTPTEGVPTCFH